MFRRYIALHFIFLGSCISAIDLPRPNPNNNLATNCPKYFEMISARPDSKIVNRLDADGATKRTYPLGLVLSIVSRRGMHRSKSVAEIGSIIGFVTGAPYDPVKEEDGTGIYPGPPTIAVSPAAHVAAQSLLRQYPELADIKYPKFKSEKEVYKFLDELEEKFGKNLLVIQTPQP